MMPGPLQNHVTQRLEELLLPAHCAPPIDTVVG